MQRSISANMCGDTEEQSLISACRISETLDKVILSTE